MVRHGENGMPVANEAMRGKIMHSRFEGPGVNFYASDNPDAEPMRGSAHILMLDDRETIDRLSRLAEELTESLAYLERCRSCSPNQGQDDCCACENHGEDREVPLLVDGLANHNP